MLLGKAIDCKSKRVNYELNSFMLFCLAILQQLIYSGREGFRRQFTCCLVVVFFFFTIILNHKMRTVTDNTTFRPPSNNPRQQLKYT